MGDEITRLASELGELRATAKATDAKLDDLKIGITKLTEAMTAVVRLDVEFKQHSMAMDTLLARQTLIDQKLNAIDRELPGLLEVKGWVVRALTMVVSAVGLAVLGMVIIKQ